MEYRNSDKPFFLDHQTQVSADAEASFISKVFLWMFVGLLMTGFTAFSVSNNPEWMEAIHFSSLRWLVMLAPIGLVILMGTRVHKMSAVATTVTFFVFSTLMGLSLSYIFMLYTTASITNTFFISAATFGVMAAYGYITKKDLTKMGSLLYMALIGLIITSVVNWFIGSSMIYWISSGFGVLIFVGLTAYDTQRIKQMAHAASQDEEMMQKGAILGALSMYLNFVNLFLYLLRFFGDRD